MMSSGRHDFDAEIQPKLNAPVNLAPVAGPQTMKNLSRPGIQGKKLRVVGEDRGNAQVAPLRPLNQHIDVMLERPIEVESSTRRDKSDIRLDSLPSENQEDKLSEEQKHDISSETSQNQEETSQYEGRISFESGSIASMSKNSDNSNSSNQEQKHDDESIQTPIFFPKPSKEFTMTANEISQERDNTANERMVMKRALMSSMKLDKSAEIGSFCDPLHVELAHGDLIGAKILLDELGDEAPARLSARDTLGRTAAHVICLSQNEELLKLIMGSYRKISNNQLDKRIEFLENEKRKLLPALKTRSMNFAENYYTMKKRMAIVDAWYQRELARLVRLHELRVESYWLKMMSCRDINGKTPIHYAVSLRSSPSFIKKLFTIGQGRITSSPITSHVFGKNKSLKIFEEDSLYESFSGHEVVSTNQFDALTLDSTIDVAEPKRPNTVLSVQAYEISKNYVIPINDSTEVEIKSNFEIVLPWLFRSMLKRAKSLDSKSERDDFEALRELMLRQDMTGSGLLLLHELGLVLKKLGIRLTREILIELCMRFPSNSEDTELKWKDMKEQFRRNFRRKKAEQEKNAGVLSDSKSGSDAKGENKSAMAKHDIDLHDSDSKIEDKHDMDLHDSDGKNEEDKHCSNKSESDEKASSKVTPTEENQPKTFQLFFDTTAQVNEEEIYDPYIESEKYFSVKIDDLINEIRDKTNLIGLDLIGTTSTESRKLLNLSNNPTVHIPDFRAEMPENISIDTIRKLRAEIINIGDIYGITPLTCASSNGDNQIVQNLLDMDANVVMHGAGGINALSVTRNSVVQGKLEQELLKTLSVKFEPLALHNSMSMSMTKEQLESIGHAGIKNQLFDSFVSSIQHLKSQNWQYERTPLSWAVYVGLYECVQKLVLTEDVNACDVTGRSAMHEVATLARFADNCETLKTAIAILDCLVIHGVNINAQSNSGRNALHEFFGRNQDEPRMKNTRKPKDLEYQSHRRIFLVKLLTFGVSVTQTDRSGMTAVHYCAKQGSSHDMITLLEKECDPRKKNSSGYTALHIACFHGKYNSAQVITRWDADNLSKANNTLDIKTVDGKLAIQLFPPNCSTNCLDTLWHIARLGQITKLINYINRMNHSNENSDLENESVSWVKCSMDSKTRVNKLTALHCAVIGYAEHYYHDQCDTKNQKIKRKLDVIARALRFPASMKPQKGAIKKKLAISVDHKAVISALLMNGAHVDSLDLNCRTPLSYAASLDLPDVCEMLLNAGADVNSTDIEGNTPLHNANVFGASSTVSVLESRMSPRDPKNFKSATPIECFGCVNDYPRLIDWEGINNSIATDIASPKKNK